MALYPMTVNIHDESGAPGLPALVRSEEDLAKIKPEMDRAILEGKEIFIHDARGRQLFHRNKKKQGGNYKGPWPTT